eukprot:SM000030S11424  [mRNA]  locus=s30:676859:678218:+ [translate_table: standard]
MDAVVKAMAGVTTAISGREEGRVSKAQKRKDKKLQQEAEREQRIAEEQSDVVSERALEHQRLRSKLEVAAAAAPWLSSCDPSHEHAHVVFLTAADVMAAVVLAQPLGLAVKEVKPDGHCLYRAVEDQLGLEGGDSGSSGDYLSLRRVAAGYMREHPDDFVPFVHGELGQEDGARDSSSAANGDESTEMLESYCRSVEGTAAWGGQLELGALAHALHRRITVYTADGPEVEMGEDYGKGAAARPPVRLSYHRHAYGLGEHYNSVVPAEAGPSVDADEA